jgi:hypothetical protein
MTSIKHFLNAIKTTFTNPGALAVYTLLYALLLLSSYFFISTREATMGQVLVTYALLILIPALFFVLQSSIINRVREQKFRWRVIVIDALKFAIVAIPILLVAWVLYYLLGKWAGRYPAPVIYDLAISTGPKKPQPLHWPSVIFATLRFVLMGIAVPLAAIHIWIAVAGGEIRSLFAQGPIPFLKRIGAALGRAFSSDSMLIYGLGLIFFFIVPYAVLFAPWSPQGTKTAFAAFIVRLIVAFVFSLLGWVVTVSALVRFGEIPAPVVSAPAVRDVPAEAAA